MRMECRINSESAFGENAVTCQRKAASDEERPSPTLPLQGSSPHVRWSSADRGKDMRLVRIGLGTIDTTVGAFRENTDRAIAAAHAMAADGVTIGVLPEQAIGGYPVEDLIQWQGFVSRQWPELERFARQTAALPTVFVIGVSVLHDG